MVMLPLNADRHCARRRSRLARLRPWSNVRWTECDGEAAEFRDIAIRQYHSMPETRYAIIGSRFALKRLLYACGLRVHTRRMHPRRVALALRGSTMM
jgi:hypothetical protein